VCLNKIIHVDQIVKLTVHLHLLQTLKMCGTAPALSRNMFAAWYFGYIDRFYYSHKVAQFMVCRFCDYDVSCTSRMYVLLSESCSSVFRKARTPEDKIVNVESCYPKQI